MPKSASPSSKHSEEDIDVDAALLQEIGYEASAVRVFENLQEIATGDKENNYTSFNLIEEVWPKWSPLAAHDLIAGPTTVSNEQVSQVGHIVDQVKVLYSGGVEENADLLGQATRDMMRVMYPDLLFTE